MAIDLTTTNVLLGILATVSVIEALAVIGLFVGAYFLFRRMMKVIAGLEERQVAPAAARVTKTQVIYRAGTSRPVRGR